MALNIKSFFPVVQVCADLPGQYVTETRPAQEESNIYDPKQPARKPTQKRRKKKATPKERLNIIT